MMLLFVLGMLHWKMVHAYIKQGQVSKYQRSYPLHEAYWAIFLHKDFGEYLCLFIDACFTSFYKFLVYALHLKAKPFFIIYASELFIGDGET